MDDADHLAILRLVARDEIHQLVLRYAWLLDTRDVDGLAALFVEDVRLAGGVTGRAALRDAFVEQLAPLGPTTLFVGNHLIELGDPQPEAATAVPVEATGIVYCRGYIQERDQFIEQMIVYSDRYRCEGDRRWRFVSRRHELFYGVSTSERPYDQPAANWPAASTGVGTLPFRLESWQRFHSHDG